MVGMPTDHPDARGADLPGGGAGHDLARAAGRVSPGAAAASAMRCSSSSAFTDERTGRRAGSAPRAPGRPFRGWLAAAGRARARASRTSSSCSSRPGSKGDAGALPPDHAGPLAGARARHPCPHALLAGRASLAAVFGGCAPVHGRPAASATSGSTRSRSSSPRRSTCWGAPSAPAIRSRPGSRWWPTRPASRSPSEFRRTFEEQRFGLAVRGCACWPWPTG